MESLSRARESEHASPPRSQENLTAQGARLREIRGERSREEFGEQLGTHRNTIERYEKGLRPMDDKFLRAVIENNPSWNYEWLVSGRGDKRGNGEGSHPRVAAPLAVYRVINDQLLAEVMREIENEAGEHLAKVTVGKRAALIAAVYDDAVARGGGVNRDTVLRLVKLTI